MIWTKQHSQNAVAAKARLRMAVAEPPPLMAELSRARRLRGRAKWRLQIRDLEHGDSLTLTLHRLPWPARYVDTEGMEHSARSVGKLVQTFLRDGP